MAVDCGDDKGKHVRKAAVIAIAGNFALAAAKITIGLLAGSLAVLGDGIDSSTDVVIAAMSLVVASVISQPSDKEHPWGHGRAETVATVLIAFIILLAGFQLSASAVARLTSGAALVPPSAAALWVTSLSILGKAGLAASQYRIARKSGSAIVLANAKNMASDIVISSSVLAGLAASIAFSLPVLDTVIALLVGIWVMKTALGIFLEQNMELMDGTTDEGLYRALFDAVRSVPGAGNPHKARIRKMASSWDIDLDIEVDGDLTVREAHDIAEGVERAVKCQIADVYDIMVHVEPEGSVRHGEQFGLSASDVEER